MNLDNIITESINSFLNNNLVTESNQEDDTNKKEGGEKKKKKFRKNAIKSKGGLRKDFDTEDDETYNKNVDDQEESSIRDILNTGYVNVSAVAQDLYPDHTKEGAQSQLRKKLEGETSDSGSKYKLKNKEVKRLRSIIATNLK